jgi:chlorophyll(ide) b reductase
MATAAAAAVHLSVHGRGLRRRSSAELPSTSSSHHRPSLLRCRAFKQEGDEAAAGGGGGGGGGGRDGDGPSSTKRRKKGPLYKLKAAIQGLAGSRSAAAEVYGGEHQYQRAVEKAEEIFFSVSTTGLAS